MTTVPARRATDHLSFRRRLRLWVGIFVALLTLTGVLSWIVIHEDRARERERIASRLAICEEIEVVKVIMRRDLREQISANEDLLRLGEQLGLREDELRREIERDRRTLESLHPRSESCEAFAVNPSGGE